MALVLTTVAGALLVGYARGGRLANLARVRLHRGWLVAVAVVTQALLTAVGALDGPVESLTGPVLLASHLALLVFVWRNRLLPGMALIFAGFAMNALVITANGAMPVSREALFAVSGGATTVIPPGKHRLLADGDSLVWLADIIPIPVLRTVVSAGDVVLGAGVAILVVNLMLAFPPPPGRRSHPEKDAGPARP